MTWSRKMGSLVGASGGRRSACEPVQETAFATLSSVRYFKCRKTAKKIIARCQQFRRDKESSS